MNADELVREVRLRFIENDRKYPMRFGKMRNAAWRSEWCAAQRRIRSRRRELRKSAAFRNLAQGYVAAGLSSTADAAYEICGIVWWLAILHPITNGDLSPQALVARVGEQEQLRSSHVLRLREIAATVTEQYADRLEQLAKEIENDRLALLGTELGLWMVGDPDAKNLGTRGGAADSAGAWRGWLIRELNARLPHLNRTPHPYSTIAALLTWAGIDGVTPMLVRSILTRS